MSSLASQLVQSASLNAGFLADRSRRKPTESYLFTGKDADAYDLESIHALALNGLLQLAKLEPAIKHFQGTLFGENSKNLDRTLLNEEEVKVLDLKLEQCLQLLGRWIMETPTGCVVEWLVRRYRINEFNIQAVLAVFLPYHESVHFAKMLSILHIKPQSRWAFLLPFKSAAQSLPRMPLVIEMLQGTDISRFVVSLLPKAIEAQDRGGPPPHSALLAFNAATIHDFLLRTTSIDEGTVAFLVPALLAPFHAKFKIQDAMLGSMILLVTLSQKCNLSSSFLCCIVQTMVEACSSEQFVSTGQLLKALLYMLEAQEELPSLEKVALPIVSLENVEEGLLGLCAWAGSEKLTRPLLPFLVSRLPENREVSILEALVASPKTPEAVIERTATLLLDITLTQSDTTSFAVLNAQKLLFTINQRHHAILTNVLNSKTFAESGSDGTSNAIEQLRLALSTVKLRNNGLQSPNAIEPDNVLSSTNPDSKVRILVVERLLEVVRTGQASNEEEVSARSALLARAQDANPDVIQALYSVPKAILPVVTPSVAVYIEHVTSVLSPSGVAAKKPRRPILRAHLHFLIDHLLPVPTLDRLMKMTVFYKVIFPFLLFTKPRQHTAEVVWSIVGAAPHDHILNEWLGGCPALVESNRGEVKIEGIDQMIEMNSLVASTIARNITNSRDYVNHLDMLLARLEDTDRHSRNLACLVGQSLLKYSGKHQIDTACKLLETLHPDKLIGIHELESEYGVDIIDETHLGRFIVSKPSSHTTSNWLQVSLLTAVLRISRPEAILNWFGVPVDPGNGEQVTRYVGLLRAVYRIANLLTSAPILMVSLLSLLFEALRKDTLAFLAGIWTNPHVMGVEPIERGNLCIIALQHGVAFLQAHVSEGDNVDFQTILPSLLVPLQSRDTEQRRIALTAISLLHQLSLSKFGRVYEFDTIYGAETAQLQYIDQSDTQKYLAALVDHREHLMNDHDYLAILHEQHLQSTKHQKKREIEYKQRMICFLASHVNSLTSPSAQVPLLRSLAPVTDSLKMLSLVPTITRVFMPEIREHQAANAESRALQHLLAACFDTSVAHDLNDSAELHWGLFLLVVRCSLTGGLSNIVLHSLESGLFRGLKSERRIDLLNRIVNDGVENPNNYVPCKQMIGALLEDVTIMCHLLGLYQPNTGADSPRSAKRAKTTGSSEEIVQPQLVLLAEVLAAKTLPGSLELVSRLLETLSSILHSAVTPAESDYIEQILMAIIEDSASKIAEMPNLAPNNMRLDVLVELLRVADNPQTFHQALLLIANLSRLAPDSVLCNVMPIFTFMGSNVFHRDDTYSLKVVQQTIDNIVPIMVSSLQKDHSTGLDLLLASKPFLRTFTDAVHHIPRHRRFGFFSHLLDVLGADFLPLLCMLLLEKAGNRIVRQANEDVSNLIQLPRSLLETRAVIIQIQALTTMLSEAEQLLDRIQIPGNNSPILLEPTEEEPDALWRRAKAIILFVGYANKGLSSSPGSEEVSQLMARLIPLTQIRHCSSIQDKHKLDDAAATSRTSLERILRAMLASDFVCVVLSILRSSDVTMQASVLALLGERLQDIAEPTRKTLSSTIVPIITQIVVVIRTHSDKAFLEHALSALKSIAITLSSGEESAMTGIIPPTLKAIQEGKCVPLALEVLYPLPSKLGPRIIPQYREIIDRCIDVIRTHNTPSATDAASDIIRALVVSVPTFWGVPEVSKILSLVIQSDLGSDQRLYKPFGALIKATVKHIPTTTVFPSLLATWKEPWLKSELQQRTYLEVLRKVIQNAPRPVVLEYLKPTFSLLLESLDLVVGDDSTIELPTTLAFRELVIKLNEATFRSLFRRLYDWAFADALGTLHKRAVFCHLYSSLLEYFKGLMTQYMSFLLGPFIHDLGILRRDMHQTPSYWLGIIQILTQSLKFDDSAFWRDDKLRQLSVPLVQQIPVHVQLKAGEATSSLQHCLDALIDTTSDDALLKSINLKILMHTRSEDTKTRQIALTCAEQLWRNHGTKLLGFVAETTTFIAECSEDDNDAVVKESFKLKDAVENAAGNIDSLLDR